MCLECGARWDKMFVRDAFVCMYVYAKLKRMCKFNEVFVSSKQLNNLNTFLFSYFKYFQPFLSLSQENLIVFFENFDFFLNNLFLISFFFAVAQNWFCLKYSLFFLVHSYKMN